MVRDEPTETLIRKGYASNEQALKKVSQNLFKQQDNFLSSTCTIMAFSFSG